MTTPARATRAESRASPGRASVPRAAYRRLHGRPVAAAAAVYAVLTLLLFCQALSPGHTLSASDYLWSAAPWAASRPADVQPLGSSAELADSVTQFQPFLQYTRARAPAVPLWNPNIAAGRPFLANAQSAVLSPFSLPAYLLPFWWSLGVIAALKVFAAALGTFLLGRALGMRFGGALLAGVVFGFSLYLLAWITWQPESGVWAFIPWLLVLTDRLVKDPGPLPGAGLAALVALQFFAGYPESSVHAVFAMVAFFCFRVYVLRRGERPALPIAPTAWWFAGALVAGAALAAALLLPLLELAQHSSDLQLRSSYGAQSLPRDALLSIMLPDYWGRWTQSTPFGPFLIYRAFYVGALPLVLAAVGVAIRPTLQRVGVAIFGAGMLAVVFGVAPFPQITSRLPVIKTFHNDRMTILFVLCVALLAGWGLDELSTRRFSRPARRFVLALAGVLLLFPVAVLAANGELSLDLFKRALDVAWGFVKPPFTFPIGERTITIIRMGSLIVWLTMMGAAVALLAARMRGRLQGPAFVALAVGLVAADLFRAGMGQNPAITKAQATQPSTPAIRYLRSRRPNRFAGLDPGIGPGAITPDVSMRLGLFDARSYDFPVERRYSTLWRRAIADGKPPFDPTQHVKLTPQALPALRLLSVTDIVQDPRERAVTGVDLPLVYRRPDARIYGNPNALPRALVVEAQQVVSGDRAELDAVLRPGFDGRRAVVTAAPLPGLSSSVATGPASGSARIVSYARQRVMVAAVARRSAELVLTDTFYPGWKATVDGKPVPVHRVDYLLRGVTLAPGHHVVTFRYEPKSWRIGWIVSLLAALGLAVAAGVGWRARRHSPPGTGTH